LRDFYPPTLDSQIDPTSPRFIKEHDTTLVVGGNALYLKDKNQVDLHMFGDDSLMSHALSVAIFNRNYFLLYLA